MDLDTYRVHFVGLPLFADRIARQMSAFDPDNVYKSFNTYYSKWDKAKFLLQFPKADLIYSINGSVVRSGVFSLAIKKQKKLVMHWVGTDVLKAMAAHENGTLNREFADYAHHVTEAPWLQEELRQIGIDAQLVKYSAVFPPEEVKPLPSKFKVLTYLGPNREEFYGWPKIRACAERLPEVTFQVAGDCLHDEKLPDNVVRLGWVDNMPKLMDESTVVLRLTQHDGMANTVMEGLAHGRYVGFTYDFPGCKRLSGVDDTVEWILSLKNRLESGELEANMEGRKYIVEEHGPQKVWGGVKALIDSVIYQ